MVPAFLPDLTPPAAATLTAPWLLACGLAALHGLLRLRARRSLALPELALDLALLWLPGAAVWLLVYRGDWVLGGFGGLAAVLTAGHFHAAGFGALVMTGLLGRRLSGASAGARDLYRLAALALFLAFPLLAAGIGAGLRPVELAGAALYVRRPLRRPGLLRQRRPDPHHAALPRPHQRPRLPRPRPPRLDPPRPVSAHPGMIALQIPASHTSGGQQSSSVTHGPHVPSSVHAGVGLAQSWQSPQPFPGSSQPSSSRIAWS